MRIRRATRSAGAGLIVISVLAGCRATMLAQVVAAALLSVGGDVSSPTQLTAADLQGLPRTSVTVIEGGMSVRYDGVTVADLIKKTGAPTGEALRGPALAHYVVATGADGYRAVFGITEGDPGFTDRPVIVADRRDGQPLSATQGPFRLIAAADTRPTRSVRTLASLTVRRVE